MCGSLEQLRFLPPACLRNGVSEDVGQACDGFLVGACYPSGPPYRHVAKGQRRFVDSIGHAAGR